MIPFSVFLNSTAFTATTWNRLEKGQELSLTNNNLRSSYPVGSGFQSVRAIRPAGGKSYYEVRGFSHPNRTTMGIATAAAYLDSNLGSGNYSYVQTQLGQDPSVGTNYAMGPGYNSTADVVGVGFDPIARLLWFSKNGVFQGNPAAGTGGVAVPAGTYYAAICHEATAFATSNFGAAAFAYAPPSGFSAWNGPDPAAIATYLNPRDKGPQLSLFNNNFAVTSSNTGAEIWNMIRGTTGRSSGKLWLEYKVETLSYYAGFGVATADATSLSYLGQDAYGFGYFGGTAATPAFYAGGVKTMPSANLTTGDIVNVAVDFSTSTLTFYKNGASVGSVAFTPGVTLYPAIAIPKNVDSASIRPTSALQTYAPPAGFSPWG